MADSKNTSPQDIMVWCVFLDDLLSDKTLTAQERDHIQGTKKAMQRIGFKSREPKAQNGA